MSTIPQPPRPPASPSPPRSGSNAVAIALLVLALIVVISGLSVWIGLRYLSTKVQFRVEKEKDGAKSASFKTPFMSLDAKRGVDPALVGLPIYPGAKPAQFEDSIVLDSGTSVPLGKVGSAEVNITVPGGDNIHILAARLATGDPLEKVRDFYKQRLGKEITKFTGHSEKGETVFEIKHGGEEKVVALRPNGSGTFIQLVRVQESTEEAN